MEIPHPCQIRLHVSGRLGLARSNTSARIAQLHHSSKPIIPVLKIPFQSAAHFPVGLALFNRLALIKLFLAATDCQRQLQPT